MSLDKNGWETLATIDPHRVKLGMTPLHYDLPVDYERMDLAATSKAGNNFAVQPPKHAFSRHNGIDTVYLGFDELRKLPSNATIHLRIKRRNPQPILTANKEIKCTYFNLDGISLDREDLMALSWTLFWRLWSINSFSNSDYNTYANQPQMLKEIIEHSQKAKEHYVANFKEVFRGSDLSIRG